MNAEQTEQVAAGGVGCVGPGLLVFVVGPSGAGKDTLLTYARERLVGRPDITFARRAVTRSADHTEAHDSLDAATFERGVAEGRFPIYWRANGLCYALEDDVREAIAGGGIIVANGSRAAVGVARRLFERVKIVMITAPPEVLSARIQARGRESGEALAGRLAREPVLEAPPDLTILNDAGVEQGGERLLAYLRAL